MGLNSPRALRRMDGDVIEDRAKCLTRNEARYLNRLSSPRGSGGPGHPFDPCRPWVSAFAGMTDKRLILRKSLWFGL